jgi:hypothetical protein
MPSRDEFGCLEVSNDDGLNFEDMVNRLSPAGAVFSFVLRPVA